MEISDRNEQELATVKFIRWICDEKRVEKTINGCERQIDAHAGLPLDGVTLRLLYRAYHAARIKGSVDMKNGRADSPALDTVSTRSKYLVYPSHWNQ